LKTNCYTYFTIKGNFDPKHITSLLKLFPSNSWAIGDKRKAGDGYYDFALWEYGRCDKYEIDIEIQCLKTIAELRRKVEVLQRIKQIYDVDYVLEIVPSIYVNEISPALGFGKDVIEFCYLTETYIDIDLYTYNEDDD